MTAEDEEVAADEATDEFAEHFDRSRPPKVLITTCYKPSGVMYKFLAEMLQVRAAQKGGGLQHSLTAHPDLQEARPPMAKVMRINGLHCRLHEHCNP